MLPGSALTLFALLAGRFGSKELAVMVVFGGRTVAGGQVGWLGTFTGGADDTVSGTRNDLYIICPGVGAPIIGGNMTLDIVVGM